MKTSRLRAGLLSSTAVLPLLCCGLAVQAQQVPEDRLAGVGAPEGTETLEEIVTIGTRVKGRTATETPVPVDVIDMESVRQHGYTEFGTMLQALAPSFNFSRTQISDGSDLFRPATLRGLGPDQVLVLVNGKRRHNRALLSLSGTVGEGATGTDFNAIPMSGVKRIEILRDGAAAQYGSDAIAGVINVELRDTPGDYYLSSQLGQTYEGDGFTWHVKGSGGFRLGESGFLTIMGEATGDEGTNRADISPTFNERVFRIGDPDAESFKVWYNMAAPLNDFAELYSFGGYSFREAIGAGFFRFARQDARAVPQLFPDGFLPRDVNQGEDISAAIGLRGDVNPNWSWDLSGVYGKNDYDLRVRNAPNVSIAAAFLLENPNATAAEIAANAGPTSGFSGSLEFEQATVNGDVYGQIDGVLPNTLYLATGFEYRDETFRIRSGDLESFSCGLSSDRVFIPSVNDQLDPDGTIDPATCGFQAFPGFRPETAGSSHRDSGAVYLDLETNVTPWWLMAVAGRYEDFGPPGDKFTWKVATRVEAMSNLAFRGAVSTGFRAPSLHQLSFTQVLTTASAAGLTETLLAPTGSQFPRFFGVEGLDIEESTNFSAGFVWSPLRNLTVTVDAFIIEIDDRIVLGNPLRPDDLTAVPEARQFLIDNLIGQANFFSNAIDTETKGLDIVITHDAQLFGGALQSTLAINLNETDIEKIDAPAGVDPDLLFPGPSRVFIEDGQPSARVNTTFDYERGPWGGVLRLNYFGPTETSFFTARGLGFPPGAIAALGLADQDRIRPGDALLVDLELAYQVTDWARIALGANNLFDVQPNELPDNAALRFISEPGPGFGNIKFPLRGLAYGMNGGFYYARVDVSF